ncbi:MAG TPA: DUF4390 domain-containing protein [Thermoanaerobaculia bacterium]|nr:DUF4390 domain-containing protein [Thermoanaerobaculia bacterium]
MRAIAALLFLFAFAGDAAAEARIEDLTIALDGTRVLASFTLADAFHHRLRERIDSGLPTSIFYQFELDKDRQRWYDRHLADTTLETVAMYDAVAQQYTVNYKLDGKLVESRTVRDRRALEQAMTRIEGVPLFTIDKYPHQWRLLVKMRAELGSRTILSMIPVAITTDWVESKKFRAPAPPA